MKGENDPKMRSDIIKLIVHKIEILKDGFEIHFHLGEAHNNNALQCQTLGATFFVYVQGTGWVDKSNGNGLGVKQSGVTVGSSKKTKENPSVPSGTDSAFPNFGKLSQNLKFFKCVGSSRLTGSSHFPV
jgi:hypothetical protein